jgi:hypothetical protein
MTSSLFNIQRAAAIREGMILCVNMAGANGKSVSPDL